MECKAEKNEGSVSNNEEKGQLEGSCGAADETGGVSFGSSGVVKSAMRYCIFIFTVPRCKNVVKMLTCLLRTGVMRDLKKFEGDTMRVYLNLTKLHAFSNLNFKAMGPLFSPPPPIFPLSRSCSRIQELS